MLDSGIRHAAPRPPILRFWGMRCNEWARLFRVARCFARLKPRAQSRRCVRIASQAMSVTLVMALAATVALPAQAQQPAPRCPRCDAAVDDSAKVLVTDFAAKRDLAYCGLVCALRDMLEKYPTSRAVARDPFAGKEVRVIRTGVRWVAWPKQAVFLYLPEAQDLDLGARCLAFPSQVEYIQYLATHPAVSEHRPKPLRLPALLDAVRKQKPN